MQERFSSSYGIGKSQQLCLPCKLETLTGIFTRLTTQNGCFYETALQIDKMRSQQNH